MGYNGSSILIVDDNSQNLQVLGNILQQNGFSVEFAQDGNTVLEWINSKEFDLILLDIMMPGMDGFEVIERVKSLESRAHIPVIFLTAKTDPDSLIKGFEMGAVDYIVKPFNKSELLARVNTHLKLKQVTDKLKYSLEKEKELSMLKTRFISIASHEFRTPLTSILALSEIIGKYSDKMSREELNERVEKIKDEVSYMTAILEDILIIGKSESDKLDFNPVKMDIIKYTEELVKEFRMIDKDHRNIKLELGADKMMEFVDKKWIKHIFNNLLSNAVKYSAEGTDVTVSIREDKGTIVIVFRDEGIGIPEEDKALLFDTFHRAKNVGSIPGTGLGLSIVKKAVELHDGSINLESIEHQGTTITIRIPKS